MMRVFVIVVSMAALYSSVFGQALGSDTCGESYTYTEFSSNGFESRFHVSWSDTEDMKYRRGDKEGTQIWLPRFCPFDGKSKLCSIPPFAPYLIPEKIPEDGVINLEVSDNEKDHYLRLRFPSIKFEPRQK